MNNNTFILIAIIISLATAGYFLWLVISEKQGIKISRSDVYEFLRR